MCSLLRSRNLSFALLLLLAGSAGAFDFFEPVVPPRSFQVMAHRGAMRAAPENTRPAIERCIEDGFEWVEVDVQLTRDGQHVIFHDGTVEGKTNGTGRVQDLSLAEIKQLDAGSKFAPTFAGEQILTLPDCLALAKGRINLYLDCKRIDPARLAEEILAADVANQVVVFDDVEVLAQVREVSQGKIPIMPKWHPEDALDEWVAKWQPDAIEINAEEVTPEICAAFHAKGIKVQAKVLDENDRPEVWDRMLEAGVDWLQTDLAEDILTHRLWRQRAERPIEISFHRAACRYAPENTLPAIDKAIQMGADYIEFDVRPSMEGDYFLLHDGQLDRTTNGKGPIKEMSAPDIQTLTAGAWFGKAYASARVPGLSEALDRMKGHVKLYVDAKDIPPADLARMLDEKGLVEDSVVYQSPQYLQELARTNPKIKRLCPLGDPAQVESLQESVRPYAFDTAWDILSQDLIRRCHDLGVKVFSDAMDEHERIEDYQRATDWGIDLIQTDCPLRVIRAVELREAGAKR